jgi:hypothetical protein
MFGRPGGDPDLLRPFKGVRYRLDAEAGCDGEGEGELVLLGNASATRGYVSYPGTPIYRSLTGGGGGGGTADEYRTGDRFCEEEDPRGGSGVWLRYLCRKDDLLVHTSGEMTNPTPTEQIMLAECGATLTEGGALLCGNHMPRPVLVLEISHVQYRSER